MKTISASAHSTEQNSFKAGKEMAQHAKSKVDASKFNFAFVFASAEHNYKDLLKGIRSVIGNDIHVVGGMSSGIITNDFLAYEGILAGILIIATSDISFETKVVSGLEKGEYAVGKNMGVLLKDSLQKENSNLLFFYDSVATIKNNYFTGYQATKILKGIQSEIKNWPYTAGVGMITSNFTVNNKIWVNDEVIMNSLLSLIIAGNVKMHTTIMHGCKPASDYHKITKTSDGIILEFDDKPAKELVKEYLGDPESIDWKNILNLITIGVNKGEKYGPFIPENYVNRLVQGIDEETGGLVVIESDLKAGDEFQFMRRCIETDMVKKGALDLIHSLNGRRPLFALYISCLGRIKKIFGSEREEAEEIQEALGSDIPLIGIYSGVEIAKVNDILMPLDWTGVLCIFTES